MKNSDYWKQRFEQLEKAQNSIAKETLQEVERQYREAIRDIEGKINTWYQRLAANNGISMAEARKLLSASELKEFKWSVEDYIKYGKDNAVSGKWIKQLENASAKFHISKYEALKIQTQQSLEMLFAKQVGSVSDCMKDVYTNGFYRTAYEVQKGLGYGWDISGINQGEVERIISKPWAVDKYNFSERLWKNKDKLINEVHKDLTQNIIMGGDPQKAIDSIAKKMNMSKNVAGRLVMTEEAYFSSAAQRDCFNELDVEEYEIVATLDSLTSEICQEMDGKHFPMKEFQAGVTAPPFHPWCRSTTCPYFEEDFGSVGERAARGKDGKTYYVPADTTYKEWKDSFVDGGDKSGFESVNNSSGVDNSAESGIIEKQQFIYATSIAEAEKYAQHMFANNVNYSGAKNLENVNIVNRTLFDLTSEYPIAPLSNIFTNGKLKCTNARSNGGNLQISTNYLNNPGKAIDWASRIAEYPKRIADYKEKIKTNQFSKSVLTQLNKEIKRMEDEMKFSRWSVSSSAKDRLSSTIKHEYAHILADQFFGQINGNHFCGSYEETAVIRQLIKATYLKAQQTGDIFNISMYANKNECEFFAECFAAHQNKEKLPDYIEKMLQEALKK